MKKYLLILLLHSFFGFSQDPASIDPNFISTLTAVPILGFNNNNIYSVSIQSDSKILIGGTFASYNSKVTNVASIIRLNTDGSKDDTFSTPLNYLNNIYTIAVQSDNKILIGGGFSNYSSTILRNKIARLNNDGSIDSSFNIGTGFNNTVKSIVVQPDGKIIVGGDFTNYNGNVANRLIRLNLDGSVDTTFNIGSGLNNPLQKIHLQADGKILLGGVFTLFNGISANKLIRINANGTVDSTFNIGTGFLLSSGVAIVNNLALQMDNKIIVVGSFSTYNGSNSNNIVRLNVDGSIDTSFNSGSGFTSLSSLADIKSVIIQNDGKIIACGFYEQYNGNSTSKKVIRINSDGSMDSTFDTNILEYWANGTPSVLAFHTDEKIIVGGDFSSFDRTSIRAIARLDNNGYVDTTFGCSAGFSSEVVDFFEQTDGKILVCGSFGSYNKTNANKIARINSSGSLDALFNTGIGFNHGVYTILTQPDGKILVGGSFTKYKTNFSRKIARLNSDGTLDSTFNVGSGFNVEFLDSAGVNDIKLQSDGKIIVVGYLRSWNGTTLYNIVRLNNDGSIDATFNAGMGFNGIPKALKIQTDGKIIVAGAFSSYNGTSVNGIIRLNTNGTIDSTFSSNFVNGSASGPTVSINKIAIQSDGKILAIGSFTSVNGNSVKDIVRLNANGSYDSTFTTGSGFTLTSSDITPLKNISIQSDGRILLVGHFYMFNGISCNGIIRLNTNGSKDSTFSTITIEDNEARTIQELSNGKIIVGGEFKVFGTKTVNRILILNSNGTQDLSFNVTGFNDIVNTTTLQPDNKILVGGIFTSYSGNSTNRIARLNTDGSFDNSFAIGSGFEAGVNKIILQQDNKILVGGDFNTYNGNNFNRLIRLHPDGTSDVGFNAGGTGFNNSVYTIAIQADNKIIVGGNFTSYNGVVANRILRLNSDGSIDSSFSIGSGFDNTIIDLAIQSDGKILIGGNFITYNGNSVNRIVRLNSNGSVDPTFVIGTGCDNVTRAIVMQSDGKIILGGNFTTYNGATVNRIVRLNSNGLLDGTFTSGNGCDDYVNTVAIDSNNNIIIGGNFSSYNGTFSDKLVRIKSDGTIDSTFNTNIGFDNTVNVVTIQQDGKILAGGTFSKYNNIQSNYFLRLIGDNTTLSSTSFISTEKDKFILYPNPVQNVINISRSDDRNAPFKIFNLLGQQVKSGILEQKEINVSNLKEGIYIFELNEGQKTRTKKFIKK